MGQPSINIPIDLHIKCNIIVFEILECLKSDYKKHSEIGSVHLVYGYNYTYPNCTMPWQQSMLGKHWDKSSNNEDELVTCDGTLLNNLFYLDYEFLKIAARGDNPNCLRTYIDDHG